MIPLQELIHEPADRPHHSTRLAKKLEGMYINAVEKAMKKKKKEVNAISGTTKSSKSSKPSSAGSQEQEENIKTVPPFLLAEELIRMGQECGFDDKEEGELLEAAGQMKLDG
jgi:hypothetical protein